MRREFRKKQQNKQNNKVIIYSIAGVIVFITIILGLLMYSNSLDENVEKSQLNAEQIASIVENETDTESASSSIGRSIEEEEARQNEEKSNETIAQTNTNNSTNSVENKTNASNTEKQSNTSNSSSKNSSSNSNSNSKSNSNSNKASNQTTSSSKNTTTKSENDKENADNTNVAKEETKKELTFQKPLEGEIMREFAKDNLIFSDTLQEWVTHNGIDIKAEKATVVQAAEDGVIKSIKNDPRFGLTIVIEHENGFQTVYANLLSSEFVTEGENVTKGQSIGTVGNTAAFESADEPHLHFEVIKDSIQVDPNIYIK